jgi:NAD+ kinase
MQLKLRGQAPKALRWKRLEQRYKAHKQCVTDLLGILRQHQVGFSCVNRVELDRQHLADVDLVVAVGGDGTVLSSAHFLDHGTIPLLGINSDPNVRKEDRMVKKKKSDERRSHGALCFCSALDMEEKLGSVLYGGGHLHSKTRIRCKVKGTFSETSLVPALNDILLANPSPAAVSRFRMGWMHLVPEGAPSETYGTVTRFGRKAYDVTNSINVWSSGMWVSTATGSTAAMRAAGGMPMDPNSEDLQYLIREHMIERLVGPNDDEENDFETMNNGIVGPNEKLHIRWNSQRGRIFIDGSHLSHDLELGDEILIDSKAPPLKMFSKE